MRYIFLLLVLFFVLPSYANELVKIDNVQTAIEHAQENDKQLALVFIADWCEFCGPQKKDIMDNIETIHEEGWIVCFVDYDSNKDLVRQFKVEAVPTTILLVGDKMRRIRGYSSYSSFARQLEFK